LEGKPLSDALKSIAHKKNDSSSNLLRQAIEGSSVLSLDATGDSVCRKRSYSVYELERRSTIVDLEGGDLEEIMELLRHHPHAEYKIG